MYIIMLNLKLETGIVNRVWKRHIPCEQGTYPNIHLHYEYNREANNNDQLYSISLLIVKRLVHLR